MALQNLFEMLSFAATTIFADPEQFQYPVYISFGAVTLSACCFAAYVQKERGHLIHVSRCLTGEDKYQELEQVELA
jgi:iron-regulated transporter 1